MSAHDRCEKESAIWRDMVDDLRGKLAAEKARADSLALLAQATEQNRLKDNAALVAERDALRARVAELEGANIPPETWTWAKTTAKDCETKKALRAENATLRESLLGALTHFEEKVRVGMLLEAPVAYWHGVALALQEAKKWAEQQ